MNRGGTPNTGIVRVEKWNLKISLVKIPRSISSSSVANPNCSNHKFEREFRSLLAILFIWTGTVRNCREIPHYWRP
jgi:hypothetical protein